MSSSKSPVPAEQRAARLKATGELEGDVTATDLPVRPPEYLREMHAALERSERAYSCGDLALAAAAAAEGQAAIRLMQSRYGHGGLPPHYPAFFHCFRIQGEFRQALALFKQAALRRQPGAERQRQVLLKQAWQVLEPVTTGLAENFSAELLVYDHPIAGRVLRGVLRLRLKLRDALGLGR
jgi:hypothetical protein